MPSSLSPLFTFRRTNVDAIIADLSKAAAKLRALEASENIAADDFEAMALASRREAQRAGRVADRLNNLTE